MPQIRFFWEAGAFNEEGKLVDEPAKCINKVGHALHDLNPVFQHCSYDPRVGRIARQLGVSVPLAVQSMYIFKQPKIGGEVCTLWAPHVCVVIRRPFCACLLTKGWMH